MAKNIIEAHELKVGDQLHVGHGEYVEVAHVERINTFGWDEYLVADADQNFLGRFAYSTPVGILQ